MTGAHDEDEPLGLEAQLGDPVEETEEARSVRAEGRADDHEGGRSRLGTLQGRQSQAGKKRGCR